MANNYYPTEKRILNKSTYDDAMDGVTTLKRASNIVNVYDKSTVWYGKFARNKFMDPHNTYTGGTEYLFFTRPDLYLTNRSGTIAPWVENTSPYLYDSISRFPYLVEQLEYYRNGTFLGSYPFSPLMSNAVAPGSTLDLPDLSADIIEGPVNAYGSRIMHRGTSLGSDEDLDFSIEFYDNKYLDIYTMFKMYDEYERCKWAGKVSTDSDDDNFDSADSHWQSYTENKVMHDAITIYKFVVGDDGMSLIYWACATGCFPKDISRSTFADLSSSTDGIKVTVGFKCHWITDMDPRILTNFNLLNEADGVSASEIQLYKPELGRVNEEWAVKAKIVSASDKDSGHKYAPTRKYYFTWLN